MAATIAADQSILQPEDKKAPTEDKKAPEDKKTEEQKPEDKKSDDKKSDDTPSVVYNSHLNPATSQSCTSCPSISGQNVGPPRFNLKPGEMMFDKEGSTQSTMGLGTYIHMLAGSNVFNSMFTHSQLVQKDVFKCCASFHSNPNANRFSDIPCFEDTRVRVPHPKEPHDYIHASWVDGYRDPHKFIVCQAPMPHTMEHFWKMQWQEKTGLVISMIQMYDVEPPEQSLRYVPVSTGDIFTAGEFSIKHQGTRHVRGAFDATVLKVTHKGQSRRMLSLIYYDWEDKGTPNRPAELLMFIADMNFNRMLLMEHGKKDGWLKEGEMSPISINCLAGTGRSCVIVALDIICRKMDDTVQVNEGPYIDVEDTIMRMRSQRAMAVQKPEQYLLIQLSSLEHAVRCKYVSDRDWADIDLEGFKYKERKKKKKDSKLQVDLM